MQTFKAIERGYVDGDIKEPGDIFTTVFTAPVVHENGKPVIENGVVKAKEIDPPSWVEVVGKAEAKKTKAEMVEENLVGPDMKPIAQAAAKVEEKK